MSDIVLVGQSFDTLDVPPALESYTKVLIHVGTATDENGKEIDLVYRSPNIPEQDFDNLSGSLMEITLPWATQDTADALYNRIVGHEYQPYELSGAVFDPAAEIGDGIEAGDMYSVLASHDLNMTSLSRSDSAAPAENESDIEFPQLTAQERSIRRKINTVQSSLRVDIDNISVEVIDARGDSATLSIRLGNITQQVTNAEGAIATLSNTVDAQGASISAVVTDGKANGELIIQAINGTSTTKIHSDVIDLEAITIHVKGEMTWDDVAEDAPDFVEETYDRHGKPTNNYITTITRDTIETTNITAVNLKGQNVMLYGLDEDDEITRSGYLALGDATSADYAVELGSYGALRLYSDEGSIWFYSQNGEFGTAKLGGQNILTCLLSLVPHANGNYDLGYRGGRNSWNNLYIVNEPTVTSDRRAKNSIDYDLSGLEGQFMRLRPCSYKRNGTDETSLGFIAQDVDEVLGDGFAIVSKPDTDDGLFALKLEQLIALNTHMIQTLWKKVEILEQGRNQ